MTVQKADPAARRRAIVIAALTAAAGSALVAIFTRPDVMGQAMAGQLAERLMTSPQLALPIGFALMLPAIAVAMYLYVMGGRIARAGRFPLPGQAVIRDTRVKEGPAALRHAQIMRLLSLLLLLLALAFPVYLWFVFEQLAGSVDTP